MYYYTYILECQNGMYYTGYTNDLVTRFQKDCAGRGARYIPEHPPVKIAYYEVFEDKKEAVRREHIFKKMTHKEKAELIAKYPQIYHNRVNEEALK